MLHRGAGITSAAAVPGGPGSACGAQPGCATQPCCRGVSQFELHCAHNRVDLPFETLTQLYAVRRGLTGFDWTG